MPPTSPNRDLALTHRLVQARWPALAAHLGVRHGWTMFVNEGYRPEARQQWLYGAGRTPAQLTARGLDPALARPTEPCVTNAWSAATSAHGWTEAGQPAAAAVDVVPLGPDNKPWTSDDPWAAFVLALAEDGPVFGLVHFHAPGKAVWDQPHLQLVEWSDREHKVLT